MPRSASRPSVSVLLGALALVVAMCLPVVFLTTPPLIDVLGHMGRYELQTGLDAQPWLQQLYLFRWQVIGNLGADLLVEAAEPMLGVVGATRLAVTLVPVLATSGILLLSREVHDRITPHAILALALVYALPFTWGFLNFSLAMALALLAFTLWRRLGRTRAIGLRAAIFLPIGLALWLCHTFGWAFLGILCVADSLARRRAAGAGWTGVFAGTALDNLPLLAPLLPMLAWRSGAAGAGIDGWFDIAEKAAWLISIQRLGWEWTDKLCAALLLVAVYAGWRGRGMERDRSLALAAVLALATFLLLPRQIFGSVFADMRLAPYAVMLGLLAVRTKSETRHARRGLMILALAFLGLRLILTTYIYHDRERQLEQHLTTLRVIPEHARLATLIEVPCHEEWDLPWFSHIGSVALVRRHVFANDQWANSSMNPLRVRFPAAGRYATDDRQLFYPERCGMTPTLRQSLRAIPLRAFTHVWVIGVNPKSIPARPGMDRVWSSPDAAMFRVGSPVPLAFAQQHQRISKLSKLQP